MWNCKFPHVSTVMWPSPQEKPCWTSSFCRNEYQSGCYGERVDSDGQTDELEPFVARLRRKNGDHYIERVA
jgi:hypothetical protein